MFIKKKVALAKNLYNTLIKLALLENINDTPFCILSVFVFCTTNAFTKENRVNVNTFEKSEVKLFVYKDLFKQIRNISNTLIHGN